MEKPEISKYTALEFLNWNENHGMSLTPKFQRREVWKTPARSFFIDSILRDIPIPPIFIRLTQSEDRKRIVREIIDGQQRLRALLAFMQDEYALSKTVENHGGKRYSQLPQSAQDHINTYSFVCEVFKSLSDTDVLTVFARVNTYSVALNAQELRNGKYFGLFKQTVYALALEHLEFWRQNKIFTESAIARMDEVELTSELLIAEVDGQQDKKQSIDRFYLSREDEFPEQSKVSKAFRTVIDAISEHIGSLKDSEFRRSPLFYTLFCVVYHRLFKLVKEDLPTVGTSHLTAEEGTRLKDAVLYLSEKISDNKQGQKVSDKDTEFVNACLRQTDNIRPRRIRFVRLYNDAFI